MPLLTSEVQFWWQPHFCLCCKFFGLCLFRMWSSSAPLCSCLSCLLSGSDKLQRWAIWFAWFVNSIASLLCVYCSSSSCFPLFSCFTCLYSMPVSCHPFFVCWVPLWRCLNSVLASLPPLLSTIPNMPSIRSTAQRCHHFHERSEKVCVSAILRSCSHRITIPKNTACDCVASCVAPDNFYIGATVRKSLRVIARLAQCCKQDTAPSPSCCSSVPGNCFQNSQEVCHFTRSVSVCNPSFLDLRRQPFIWGACLLWRDRFWFLWSCSCCCGPHMWNMFSYKS